MSTGDGRADTAGVLPADETATARSASPLNGAASSVEVVVGKVARAHGLRGDVLVDVRTDEPAKRFAIGSRLRTLCGDLTVASTAWHGTRLLTRFEEVSGKDAADALRGSELLLEVSAEECPEDPEEFYDHQLIGLRVLDAEGLEVGQIAEVVHLPAQDLLSVRMGDAGRPGEAEILVPFVHALVPTVDLGAGRVVLDESAESLLVTANPTAGTTGRHTTSDAPGSSDPPPR